VELSIVLNTWLTCSRENMEQGKVKDGETHTGTAAEKTNKQKKKVVSPTVEELQKLERESIVQCDPSTVISL